ncbi:MAG TPA: hypothetical protein PKW18_14235 [Candidatus Sumerlaeota bacterium]|nr:hypothetical protein [Candidatus Sumerlaeota bacterium]
MSIFEHTFSIVNSDGSKVAPSESLKIHGAVLLVSVGIPTGISGKYVKYFFKRPEPVKGLALIDTGATMTSVDEDVCKTLGLIPTGTIPIWHAGGTSVSLCYPIEIEFLGTPIPTMSHPRVATCHLSQMNGLNYILLLGRDILSMMKFTYNGLSGRIELAF